MTALPDKDLDNEAISVGAQCLLRKAFDGERCLIASRRASPAIVPHVETAEGSTMQADGDARYAGPVYLPEILCIPTKV
jgi:hypothetical protein